MNLLGRNKKVTITLLAAPLTYLWVKIFLTIEVPFSLQETQISAENDQMLSQKFKSGRESVTSKTTLVANNISDLANENAEFRNKFCKYKLFKAKNKPHICLYSPDQDVFVSKTIMNEGMWESQIVATVVKHLQLLQATYGPENVVFIDLGANVGTFTLTTLSYGFKTISVDPLNTAAEKLATSIVLNGFSHLATFYHKAIADRPMCGQMHVLPKNKGGSSVREIPCDVINSNTIVTTITLDQIAETLLQDKQTLNIVMKMDIQTFEPLAILGGKEFFRQLKVRLVFLEWAELGKALSPTGPLYKGEEHVASIGKAFSFLLHEMKYEVRSFKDQNIILEWEDRNKWPGDIIFTQPGFWRGVTKHF